MRSSRLFRGSLFFKNSSILMIWGCFTIASNLIRSMYCCSRHTMHANMVFSTHYILGSGGLLVCSVHVVIYYYAVCLKCYERTARLFFFIRRQLISNSRPNRSTILRVLFLLICRQCISNCNSSTLLKIVQVHVCIVFMSTLLHEDISFICMFRNKVIGMQSHKMVSGSIWQ